MPISNPCTWFINGNDEESFTYEGGSILYHFSPHDNGLSGTMENNVVFFANSEAHARSVLIRMLEFRINTHKKYKKSQGHDGYRDARIAQAYLDNIATIILEPAPTDQFYVVGWASNDTIL